MFIILGKLTCGFFYLSLITIFACLLPCYSRTLISKRIIGIEFGEAYLAILKVHLLASYIQNKGSRLTSAVFAD